MEPEIIPPRKRMTPVFTDEEHLRMWAISNIITLNSNSQYQLDPIHIVEKAKKLIYFVKTGE